MAVVAHPVADPQRATPQIGLQPAAQHQVLAERHRLAHLPLDDQGGAVEIQAGQPCLSGRDPPVQRVVAPRAARRPVEVGRVRRGVYVIEPAGGQQPTGEGAQGAEAVGLDERRVPDPGRREPPHRDAAHARPGDVQRPVDQDVDVDLTGP